MNNLLKKYKLFLFTLLAMLYVWSGCVDQNTQQDKKNTGQIPETGQKISLNDTNRPEINTKALYSEILQKHNFPINNITAQSLNAAGYKLYLQENYAEALALFRGSIDLNDTYAIAHYNLACMLSLLYGKKAKIDLEELFYHLERSIELDGGRLSRAKEDSDLDAVRTNQKFIKIINDNNQELIEISQKVIKILHNKRFDELALLIHPLAGIRFSSDPTLDSDDLFFKHTDIKNFFSDTREYEVRDAYLALAYENSIAMTKQHFWDNFMYNQDFAEADKIGYNEIIGVGHYIDNIKEVYPDSQFVEFYKIDDRSDSKITMWHSLRVVFQEYEQKLYVVAIIHDMF